MPLAPDTQKAEIDRLIAAGKARHALTELGSFWRENMRPAAAPYVLNRFASIRDTVPVQSCKLAILRSFTLEPATQLLQASAAVAGIDLIVKVPAVPTG